MAKQTTIGLIECEILEKCFAEKSARLPNHSNVVKAYSTHKAAGTALQRRYPQVAFADNCEAILGDHTIDLVLISAPINMQRELIGAALRSKKHVQVV